MMCDLCEMNAYSYDNLQFHSNIYMYVAKSFPVPYFFSPELSRELLLQRLARNLVPGKSEGTQLPSAARILVILAGIAVAGSATYDWCLSIVSIKNTDIS